MIAACPKCAARYRIEREKIGEGGVRLRCSRCESVFRVRAPAAPNTAAEAPARTAASNPAPPLEPAASTGAAAKGASSAAAAPRGERNEDAEREIAVLVAMPDADLAKQIAEHISAAGAPAEAVYDGVDAMLEIQRKQPKAVLLAADLPKMFGFQVCEVVKRNASLRETRVVLAGAVHHPDRYRRSPSELYGADAYVEVPDLPEGLLPILRGFGLIAPEPTQSGGGADDEETRIDTPAKAAPKHAPTAGPADLPISGMDDLSVASSEPAPPGPAGLRPAAAAGLPPLGSVPLDDAFEAQEPAREAASAPVAPESDSSPSLELDLDWAGSEAAQAQAAPAPAPSPAPARESGGGVPISLDFDFGEEEVGQAPASPTPTSPTPATPRQAAPAPPSPELAEERAQAERLARIIVSDIVLYNEEKFAAAVQAGTVATALSAELDEGRGLFIQRIDERVRREADFLLEELLRVARSRGMD